MKAGERVYNLIRDKEIDRLPVVEWAPWWNLTVDRWNNEGMNIVCDGHKGGREIQKYFGLDSCLQTYFPARTFDTPLALHHGSGIMKSEQDYEKIKKTMFYDPSIFCNKEHLKWLNQTRDEGDTVHFFTVEGFFWFPRELFGIEPHLYSFYDESELLHRMSEDYLEWLKKVIEFVGNNFKFDFMSFAEDMSYNNGAMLSKNTFDEFLAPYYKKIIPLIKKADIPVFVDSDGDIEKAVDWYAEVGAEGMFPLERQAGVDVSKYIDKQPQMTYLGHFDKMVMKKGEKAMREEFERLLPSLRRGKVIPSCDHQTPPDVSLENYKIYAKLLNEYARKI